MRAAATSTITQPPVCRFPLLITWSSRLSIVSAGNRPTPDPYTALHSHSFVTYRGGMVPVCVRLESIIAETSMFIARGPHRFLHAAGQIT